MHLSSTSDGEPDVATADLRLWWLANKDNGGADAGMFASVELDAGYDKDVEGYADVEQVIFVLSGELVLRTSDGETKVGARTALFVPFGASYGLSAAAPVKLLHFFAGAATPDALENAARTDSGGKVGVIPIAETDGMMMNDDAMGMHEIFTRILAMKETHGSEVALAGHAEFTAGKGLHAVHNHDHAGEFMYVVSGTGTALLGNGEEIEVSEGSFSYSEPGAWHGLRASSDGPIETFFAFAGKSSFNDIGYTLEG